MRTWSYIIQSPETSYRKRGTVVADNIVGAYYYANRKADGGEVISLTYAGDDSITRYIRDLNTPIGAQVLN